MKKCLNSLRISETSRYVLNLYSQLKINVQRQFQTVYNSKQSKVHIKNNKNA